MGHELIMKNPNKVLAELEVGIEILNKISGTIETTADIGKMDLAIGGLDKTLVFMSGLNTDIEDARKVFRKVIESVAADVATFEKNNANIELD